VLPTWLALLFLTGLSGYFLFVEKECATSSGWGAACGGGGGGGGGGGSLRGTTF